jgi:hypothetical protein
MLWRYSYEVLGGILIVVSSWATEQMSELWKRRAWIIFLVAAVLYSGLGVYLDRQAARTEFDFREEARKGQRDLQKMQAANTEQLKNILTRLDDVLRTPEPSNQKDAARLLKAQIQGPRFLTDAQEQTLIETLSTAKASTVRMITAGNDSETQLFSAQLKRAFELAGWNVQYIAAGAGTSAQVTKSGTVVTSPVNVSLYVPKTSHTAEITEQAFKNTKIDYARIEGEPAYSGPLSWTSGLSTPDVYIVIGPQR